MRTSENQALSPDPCGVSKNQNDPARPLGQPYERSSSERSCSISCFRVGAKSDIPGSIVISLDAGYRGEAEDFQPERQLIRRLLYSPTGLSIFFLGVLHNWFAF